MKFLFHIYKRLLTFMSLPIILQDYLSAHTGKDYGVGFFKKIRLAFRMAGNVRRVTTASRFLEHLVMATKIFQIPKSVEGNIVECGCYKGGSTVNLSLVTALCNRRLDVFDSFQGLPEPSDYDNEHYLINDETVHTYKKGSWYGSIDEVRNNITRFGNISVCTFHAGFFEDTLPNYSTECVFVFADVDLIDSLHSCLRYLWPLMKNQSYFFTHEAHHLEIGEVFFNHKWWFDTLNVTPPGLTGSGNGLGLVPHSNGFNSSIGYAVKNPLTSALNVIPQVGCK